mgnify:CR=1 FL=1
MQQQSISKCGSYNLEFINEIPVSTMDQFKVLDYFIQHNQSLDLWSEWDYKNIIQNKYSVKLRSFFVGIDKYNQTKDLVLQLSMESGINKLLDTLKAFIDDIDEEIKTIKKENDKNIALKNLEHLELKDCNIYTVYNIEKQHPNLKYLDIRANYESLNRSDSLKNLTYIDTLLIE